MEITYGNYLISVEGGKRLIDQTPEGYVRAADRGKQPQG